MKSPATEEREERTGRPAQQPTPVVYPSSTKRKRRFPVGWVILVLIVGALGFTYWYNHRPNSAANMVGHGGGFHRFAFGGGMGMSMPVVGQPARLGTLNIYLNGLGTVTPLAEVTVQSQISGQLIQVNFKEGQEVKKGELLAVVDPRPYEVAEQQAEGQLMEAQAQLAQAKSDLARYITLAKQDSIAEQQVTDQEALVSQYGGLVRADQAAIAADRLNETYCHITAPVSGRVGLRQVDPGNYVTPNLSNGIVVITQLKPMSVIFTLPEDNIAEIAERMQSGAAIPVYAYDRTMTRKIATGTLETIDNEVDTTTGTFKLRAVFPNTDEALFPNEFVNARMLVEVKQDALLIPSSAVERGQNGSFVYVVQPDKTVTAKTVTLGPVDGETQSILSGIAAGDVVVSDGADKLKEGMHVTVQAPNAPAAAPAQHRGKGKGDWKKRHKKSEDGGE